MDIGELTGERLSGRFELHEQVGEGGYGAVFRATQLSVDRECAVKVLSPAIVSDERTVERFRVEAKTTSRLSHPHTVVLYDFGRDERRSVLFLAMEMLEGESVRQLVERDGPVGLGEAARITEQVAGSLQEAHEAGTVHRDVKPGNVMLVERGGDEQFVKVIDFGIAKAVREDVDIQKSLTREDMMVGTPAYMAPEQIRGEAVDGRTDQYALAATVYFLVGGRAPFGGKTSMEVAARHLQEDPPSLSERGPGRRIPEAFDEILLKALSKEPRSRFDSVEEFGAELVEAAGAESVGEGAVAGGESSGPGAAEEGGDGRGGPRDRDEDGSTATVAVPPSDWSGDGVRSTGGAETGGEGRRPERAGDPTVEAGAAEGPERSSPARIVLVSAAVASGVLLVVVSGVAGLVKWSGVASDGAFAGGADTSGGAAAAVGGPATVRDAGDRGGRAASDAAGAPSGAPGEGPDGGTGGPEPGPLDSEVAGDTEPGERARTATSGPGIGSSAGGARRERRTAESTVGDAANGEREAVRAGRGAESGAGEPEPAAELVDLVVRMIPWGTLYIDGEQIRRGSRVEARISAGRHQLRMRQNGELVDERVIHVKSGEDHRVEMAAP